ncbi:unnamed protein product [Nippostrongylus brasiliensis]|uniref:Nitro_FeMo-Co domain-containing protein n=1 Tax=Nippostrongylus brasiliensis TaxID=27835 RepID=A0A0N4YAV1_NIPBR|nr:unnamed protein product [Nippostrongylus brasiliensis]
MGVLPRGERPSLKKLIRKGTLNVGTLTGKSREVADLLKRKDIQILSLQWKGEKAKEIGEGVKLFYKGDDGKRNGGNGVGVAVSEALKDSVFAVRRITDRIINVRVDMKDGCRHDRP